MRTITIYGYSDDLIELDGTNRQAGEPDEIPANRCDSATIKFLDDSSSTPEGLLVHAAFTIDGTWAVGIAPLTEAEDDRTYDLPNWEMRWSYDWEVGAYSTVLEIDVPDGVRISCVDPTDE